MNLYRKLRRFRTWSILLLVHRESRGEFGSSAHVSCTVVAARFDHRLLRPFGIRYLGRTGSCLEGLPIRAAQGGQPTRAGLGRGISVESRSAPPSSVISSVVV